MRARDKDFNVDPTPSSVKFKVIPPIYHQTWFLGMIFFFLCIISFCVFHIIQRDHRLRFTNNSLKEQTNQLQLANDELEAQNIEWDKHLIESQGFEWWLDHEMGLIARMKQNAIEPSEKQLERIQQLTNWAKAKGLTEDI